MNSSTLLCVVLCLGLLALRYKLDPGVSRPPDWRNRIRLARVLIAAALAMAAIGYRLQHTLRGLDGPGGGEPSAVEPADAKPPP